METAFVFGAGASAAEGASTLTQLLISAFGRFPDDGRVKSVRDFIGDVFPASNYSNIPSFEEILTPIDIALLKHEEFSEKWNYNKLATVRNNLIYCICRTLSEELENPRGLHREFISKLYSKYTGDFRKRLVFISLNYDILLDNALANLYNKGVDLDYVIDFRNFGRQWRRPRPGKTVLLLKLHGSLNWLFCPVCNPVKITPREKGAVRIFTEFAVCEEDGAQQRPLIIPPTWQKAYDNPYLMAIWLKAERELRKVNKIFFIGYSLPESDMHIRYLLLKSNYNKRTQLQVTVIDAKRRTDCKIRYEKLFRNVTYSPIGFKGLVKRFEQLEL